MKRWILLGILAAGVWATGSLTTPALAGDHGHKSGEAVNADKTGLALRGYDPVSYFKSDAPQQGNFQIAAEHHGSTYWFASEENKAAFEANPKKFLPQFGGYCAYGVAIGKKFSADPEVYVIENGKLYINLNPTIAEVFNGDLDKHIADAKGHWKNIADTPAGDI
ncbi:MAG: YHS domain-containing (seleno)protein [Planctomycetota bacterium]